MVNVKKLVFAWLTDSSVSETKISSGERSGRDFRGAIQMQEECWTWCWDSQRDNLQGDDGYDSNFNGHRAFLFDHTTN